MDWPFQGPPSRQEIRLDAAAGVDDRHGTMFSGTSIYPSQMWSVGPVTIRAATLTRRELLEVDRVVT